MQWEKINPYDKYGVKRIRELIFIHQQQSKYKIVSFWDVKHFAYMMSS